jgi:hypothetical protein
MDPIFHALNYYQGNNYSLPASWDELTSYVKEHDSIQFSELYEVEKMIRPFQIQLIKTDSSANAYINVFNPSDCCIAYDEMNSPLELFGNSFIVIGGISKRRWCDEIPQKGELLTPNDETISAWESLEYNQFFHELEDKIQVILIENGIHNGPVIFVSKNDRQVQILCPEELVFNETVINELNILFESINIQYDHIYVPVNFELP